MIILDNKSEKQPIKNYLKRLEIKSWITINLKDFCLS
jgi:hypothetical protein